MKQQRLVTLDRARLAQLYQQFAPKILDYVYRQVSSFQDAEDILIDVFVAALESPAFASLTEREQQAWLWRVARNKVIDIYRRKRGGQFALKLIDELSIEHPASNPELIRLQQEEEGNLALLIERLSPLQQQVLYLRFGENLRCSQIATRVGKRESSIRSLLSRALKLLRRYYSEQEREGGRHGTSR